MFNQLINDNATFSKYALDVNEVDINEASEMDTNDKPEINYPVMVEIEFKGNEQVSFVTNLGVASYVLSEIEYQSAAKAHESLVEYFSNLQVVPYMNDAGLQEIANFTMDQFKAETLSTNIAEYLNNLPGRAFTYLPMVVGSAIINLKFKPGVPVHYGPDDIDPEHAAAVENATKRFDVDFGVRLDPSADVQFYYEAGKGVTKTANEIRGEVKDITLMGFVNFFASNQFTLLSKEGNQGELQVVREAIMETFGKLVEKLPLPGQTFDSLPHEIIVSGDVITMQIKATFREVEA